MGAIPAAIRTLLKSRSMIGPHAPVAVVKLETGASAGTVGFEFNSVGTQPSGAGYRFTDKTLWITDILLHAVHQHRASDGVLLATITVPNDPNGCEIDGDDPDVLWITRSTTGLTKFRISTQATLVTFAPADGNYNGVAAPAGDYLWVGQQSGSKLHKVRKSDGVAVASFSIPLQASGVAWDGSYPWVSGYSATIYKINPSTGAVEDSFTGPSGGLYGLTWDGTYLWVADGTNRKIKRFAATWLSMRPEMVQVGWDGASLAQRLVTNWPNVNPADPTDHGFYSPDRGDDVPADKNEWYHVLYPGAEFALELGYGTELVQVLKGQLDDVVLAVDPPEYVVRMDGRDYGWRLLDKGVTNDLGGYVLTYAAQTVEAIARDLLIRAGWVTGDITTEATGQTIVEKVFERCTYGDALEWCMEVSGFELKIDSEGLVSFYYPTDREPAVDDESVVLPGTTAVALAHSPIVGGSEVVTDTTGVITYSSTTDYLMDYANGTIARRAGSTIGDGATVLVSYVYAQWSFREGEDIFTFQHRISRRNVYGKIRVLGKKDDDSLAEGVYTYAGSTVYGIPADKVLFVNLQQLDTDVKCQAAADQMGNDMVRRVREVTFAAVANPWVQVGHCIQVRESASTTSEIYRITSLQFTFDATGAIMEGTANHYGYTPL